MCLGLVGCPNQTLTHFPHPSYISQLSQQPTYWFIQVVFDLVRKFASFGLFCWRFRRESASLPNSPQDTFLT